MAQLALNGVELEWDEWGKGDGPALVLCHGFTGAAHDFALHTDALSGTRRLVTLDQRGHGHSTNTGDLASYTIDQLVDDLTGFIEKVGDGPVDLLGHSMGGRVALGVVLSRPDLINSLILMDTGWSFIPPDETIRALVNDFMANYDPARGVPTTLSFGGPEEDLIARATPVEWQKEKELSYLGTDAYAIKALGTALLVDGDRSIRDRLPQITCPTTVLVGSHDHPLVDQAPELAAEVGHGHLAVIEGAYHSPQLTHQAEWRAAVESHLAHAHG